MNLPTLTDVIRTAGLAQLGMAVAGLIVCRKLAWAKELAALTPVMRQLFWTYGGYILGANLFFGILCLTFPNAFLEGSAGALALCAYLILFWGARLILQFACFDRTVFGSGWKIRLAEGVLVSLVVFLLCAYLLAFWSNLR